MHTKFLHGALMLLLCLAAPALRAASVLPLGLERLYGGAENIFLGVCLSNLTQTDAISGMVVTYTTFQVLEKFKGALKATHTIKQVGGVLPGSDVARKFPGVPQFEVGKRYTLFIPPVSHLGFSSPVGLGQGSFPVWQGPDGQDMLGNGRDLEDLLQAVAPAKVPRRVAETLQRLPDRQVPTNARARAAMSLDDFRALMQGLEKPP